MADSLFDNRYRYDHIYPRGRSGETLRAVDTQDNNRPVVIKRPASNDAPPIRSGQEVSILNERKALTRLAGHPSLTALLGTGQFYIGGMVHQYIVLERAEGVILADEVLELAKRNERIPELELLVITDQLLDLLITAHKHDIVYNDVDAKHLFWNRDTYHLKVIDWGNAVFLEGDEITPQGISRQSDVFQVAEMMYFVLTGGGRMDVPRDANEMFSLDFGEDDNRLHSKLKSILTHAGHPNPRYRYKTLEELRKDLQEYRAPIERDRDTAIHRINERLRRDLSRDELLSLLVNIEETLTRDPGFPNARAAHKEIQDRLNDLEVAADLDATHIYLENGHWGRAVSLLEELWPRARGEMSTLIALLLDWAKLLQENQIQPTPPAVVEAIDFVFENEGDQAALVLMTHGVENMQTRAVQFLLAERISAHAPGILLLQPNVFRLKLALDQLAGEGASVRDPQAQIADIDHSIEQLGQSPEVTPATLRDGYRKVVDRLNTLATTLEQLRDQYGLPNRKLPLSALERATIAAMSLADNMHVVGKLAVSSPREALSALESSRQIAPTAVTWEHITALLDQLYDILARAEKYVPSADGSDIDLWLTTTATTLHPFAHQLFDEGLAQLIRGLDTAQRQWHNYASAVIQGNKVGATQSLTQASELLQTFSPGLANWFSQLTAIVNGANHVERHSLHGALGRALADGWEAFDRGRLLDAERLGIQAYEASRDEDSKFASSRLRDLTQFVREWVERSGISDNNRTQALLKTIDGMFTADELTVRNNFTGQMPSQETYLKAMSKGLVDQYAKTSSGALRVLFVYYVLLSTVEAQTDNIEEHVFWREAALKTLGDNSLKHPMMRTLDEFTIRRRDLFNAAQTINRINNSEALAELVNIRHGLENNPQSRILSPAAYSIRELENALRDWSEAEFRAAGIKIENAIKGIEDTETHGQISLTAYRAFLMELLSISAKLHAETNHARQMIASNPAEPPRELRNWHHRIYETTGETLGYEYTTQMRAWLENYDAFVQLYTNRNLRRSAKLVKFTELFNTANIDRNPAYPLFRHWYTIINDMTEFPAPPTDDPTPYIDDLAEEEFVSALPPAQSTIAQTPATSQKAPSSPLDETDDDEDDDDPPKRGKFPFFIVGILAILLVGAGIFAINSLNNTNASQGDGTPDTTAVAFTGDETPEVTQAVEGVATEDTNNISDITSTPSVIAVLATVAERGPVTATSTRTPTATNTPEDTPTPTETLTPLPTDTPLPSATPLPTLPPDGLHGRQNLIGLAGNLLNSPWTEDEFSPSEDPTVWRLGRGTALDANILSIALDADTLESQYGANSAGRIIRMEAELSLVTFNPPLLIDDEVFFGVELRSQDDADINAGLQINLVEQGVINIAQIANTQLTGVSQQGNSATNLSFRLERNLNTGAVTTYLNDRQIGEEIPFVGMDALIQPILFVKDGGVIIHVLQWSVTLR